MRDIPNRLPARTLPGSTPGTDASGPHDGTVTPKTPAASGPSPSSADPARWPQPRKAIASAPRSGKKSGSGSAPRKVHPEPLEVLRGHVHSEALKLRRNKFINGPLKTLQALSTYRTDCLEDDKERGLRLGRYQETLEAATEDHQALAEDTGILNSKDENPALVMAHRAARRDDGRPLRASSIETRLLKKAMSLSPGSIPSAAAYLGQLGVSEADLLNVVKKQLGKGNAAAINAWNALGNAFLREGKMDEALARHRTGLEVCRELGQFDQADKIEAYVHGVMLRRRESAVLSKVLTLKPDSCRSGAEYLAHLDMSEEELLGYLKKELARGNFAAIHAWNGLGNAFLAEGKPDRAVGSHLAGLQECRAVRRFDMAVQIGEHLLKLTRHQRENQLLLHLEVARDKLDGHVGLSTVNFHLQQAALSTRPEDECHVLAEMGRLRIMSGMPQEGARLMFASLNRSLQHGIPPHPRLTAWVSQRGKGHLDATLGPQGYKAALAASGNGDSELIQLRPFVGPVLGSNG